MEVIFDRRAHMVATLFDVMKSFDLVTRTILLAIQYVDTYISTRTVPIRYTDITQIGMVALWIASKYEEVEPLALTYCCEFVCATPYTFVNIEADILHVLDFRLERPTYIDVLERTSFEIYICHIACIGAAISSPKQLEETTRAMKAIALGQNLDYTHATITAHLALLHLACNTHDLFKSVNSIFSHEWEGLCRAMGRTVVTSNRCKRRRSV